MIILYQYYFKRPLFCQIFMWYFSLLEMERIIVKNFEERGLSSFSSKLMCSIVAEFFHFKRVQVDARISNARVDRVAVWDRLRECWLMML